MVKWVHKQINRITAVSGVLLLLALAASFAGYPGIQQIMLLTATAFAGVPIGIKAYQALRMKAFSIELLVTIAVIGALFIGEYVESAAVAFLFLFGAYLEARTLEKTRSSLKELIDMAPQEAVVIRNGAQEKVAVEEVKEGDHVIIRSGGKVPVDGRVIAGQGSLNEAAITGESVPAAKKQQDHVFSGTIVDHGYLEIIAEKVGADTTFAKIIELVEEAQESKSKTEKFLDRFATFYTPAVVILSILVYVLTRDLHMAITFLVVACPGALVIGAPVSNVAGIGNGAKHGVLVKGGEVMDQFSRVDTVVFDKTGTLTKGKPEVTDIHVFGNHDVNEVWRLTARAEVISEHHLGRVIVKEAEKEGLQLDKKAADGEVIKGKGLRAIVEGHRLVIGNQKLMDEEEITISREIADYVLQKEKQGNTAILAAVDGEIAGVISIADQLREDAVEALAAMRRDGVKKMVMLTGDNRHTAALVAGRLGLDAFHAGLLPEEKAGFVKQLKNEGHVVAMAGDGINDAPAIATADTGIAMGRGGTDISMETADVVLMADKLEQLSHAYSLAKATIWNTKQNTFFAVGIVFVLLAGVLIGGIHLASGMFIHEASVLIVILNAMRLLRFNRIRREKGEKLQPVEA